MNLLVSLNFVRSNDVSINLIRSVNFFFLNALKVASFSKLHHFSFYGVLLKHLFIIFILDFLIPFATTKWSNECFGIIERESKQEGGIIKKTNRRERGKGKRNIEGEKKRF